MRTYRVMLSGLGNVGRSFLELIPSQAESLANRYDISLLVVGAADSGGTAIDPAGLDVAALIAAKQARQSVSSLAGVGVPGMSALAMAQQIDADALLESTLTNLRDGLIGMQGARLDGAAAAKPVVKAGMLPADTDLNFDDIDWSKFSRGT